MQNKAEFQTRLLAWYRVHRRDLPWRENLDPYRIWVSEIMLQQTTVAAVIPHYLRWMDRLPTVDALARADDEVVHSLWQGLGYYRRCRMLHAGAKWVSEHGFPEDAAGWLEVAGVGPYTSAAIASIALGEAAPLVDGNVERVYARIEDDASPPAALKKQAWEWSASVFEPVDPGSWNQALMELGATVCTPKSPRCAQCPVVDFCKARRNNCVMQRPTPKPKTAWQRVEITMVVLLNGKRIAFVESQPGQWWAGLWILPNRVPQGLTVGRRRELTTISTTVTNHKVRIQCTLIEVDGQGEGLRWVAPEQLESLPVPSPVRKILSALKSGQLERMILEGESTPD